MIAAAMSSMIVAGMIFSGMERIGASDAMKEVAMVTSAQAQPAMTADQRLHKAVKSYDLSRVRAALAEGASVDAKGIGGSTPALIAAQISAWDICLYLLKAGADPRAANEFGVTIPKALAQSRVAPGTAHYDAMLEVAAFLEERGVLD